MKKSIVDLKGLFGCLAVTGAAFFFYLATVVIRWSKPYVTLDPAYFVFARFIFGFVFLCVVLGIRKQTLKPKRYDLLIGRTISNCIAVYCFYKSVDVTSAAEGNILNMTYPVFVSIFAWFFLKDQKDPIALAATPVAFAGIWLIIAPETMTLDLNHFWGLTSGAAASFSIIYLNVSRKYHDSETILFYLFGLGAVIIYILFHGSIHFPDMKEIFFLASCSFFGIFGQYLLTMGFRYVTAVEGGIISSTRILLAAVLGPVIASEPPLTASGWIGALLIFLVNVFLAARKVK